MEPQEMAREVAVRVADSPDQIGDFVQSVDLGGDVTDFRFTCLMRGYEGWQWSVTLYHDIERGQWTVNESSLVPTKQALLPPPWVPWKDRLEPGDLSVTDSIGTDPDDSRLEEGWRRADPAASDHAVHDDSGDGNLPGNGRDRGNGDMVPHGSPIRDATATDDGDAISEQGASTDDEENDLEQAVDEFRLSRRHVLSAQGRAQAAKRWYEGPHGPKSLSTKTSDGNACSDCGFFVPLTGDLGRMFGVCANKWSPDDGRVVSLDHGCGEHSEIDPPQTSRLWIQSEPAYDDLHIDVVAQSAREERGEVELIEHLDQGLPKDLPGEEVSTSVTVDANGEDGAPDGAATHRNATAIRRRRRRGETSRSNSHARDEEKAGAADGEGSAGGSSAGSSVDSTGDSSRGNHDSSGVQSR